MTLIDKWQNLKSDFALWKRFAMACIDHACAIKSEPSNTPNHTARLAWAETVLADYADYDKNPDMRLKALANPAIAAALDSAPDNDIVFVVSAQIAPQAV